MKGYQMKKMVEFSTADYQGFTLKEGFWYGKNLRGQAIATSTWICEGCVAIYTRSESGWKKGWHPIDSWYLPAELQEELELLSEAQQYF